MQSFHEKIINNDANHKNYDTTMHQSYSTYLRKKIHTVPRSGLVTIQVARHILCSIRSCNSCGFDWQVVCFFFTSRVLQSGRFYTGFIVPNFKLQYLMNYSSNFNNFCRFQLLAVFTTLL